MSGTPTNPTGRPPGSSGGGGYDQVGVPQPDGSLKMFTKAEFERLPLSERIRLLMGELKFFRNQQPVSSRDALRKT